MLTLPSSSKAEQIVIPESRKREQIVIPESPEHLGSNWRTVSSVLSHR
jgi:hypothetical protein